MAKYLLKTRLTLSKDALRDTKVYLDKLVDYAIAVKRLLHLRSL
jgi:hypothetical protein